jgi:hypothetical protein
MTDVVSPYLAYMFNAEKSADPFPIDFDRVWHFVYPTRTVARSSLVDSEEFCEGKDYRIDKGVGSRRGPQGAGIEEERIMLSIQCLEFYVARRHRLIFEVYRQCRKMVTQAL